MFDEIFMGQLLGSLQFSNGKEMKGRKGKEGRKTGDRRRGNRNTRRQEGKKKISQSKMIKQEC